MVDNQFNKLNQISIFLLLVGIVLCLPRDSIRNGFMLIGLLSIFLSILSFVLNTRNGTRSIYSAAYLVLTISIFILSVSKDPFSIFRKNYLNNMLGYLPLMFVAIGFFTTKGSFFNRLKCNFVYTLNILATSFGHYVIIAIASSGV